MFLFLSRFFSFDYESDKNGSGSGSSGMRVFSFFSGIPVGSVSELGSGVSVPTGIDSIGDIVPLFVLVRRGVESKVGQFIEIFSRSNLECFS